GDRVGGVGLEFHRVGACLLRCIDQTKGTLDLPVVIAGELCNHIRRLVRSDLAAGNLKAILRHEGSRLNILSDTCRYPAAKNKAREAAFSGRISASSASPGTARAASASAAEPIPSR